MNEIAPNDIPEGFCLETSINGHVTISYRTAGMGCLAVFFIVWLGIWTTGCLGISYKILSSPPLFDNDLIVIAVFLWICDFGVLTWALWLFRSNTVFSFFTDHLLIERSLFFYRRQRRI